MDNRKVQLVVVTEDLQQTVLIRRFFVALGFEPHKIRVVSCPAGTQSGEQFVRERYPVELRACRSKAAHLAIKLVIVLDADKRTVEERSLQLLESLRAQDLPDRDAGEAVVLLIPKRNIETWIHYLQGRSVDEDTVYEKLRRQGDCRVAVTRLLELHRSGWVLPMDCPDSFRRAVMELRRIL